MKARFISCCVLGMLASMFMSSRAAVGAPTTAPSATAKVVTAADAFLATLDEKQRAAVVHPFNDEQQRARWSNLPVMAVQRGGLSLKELNEAQRAAAIKVVEAALSTRGFDKVQQIMEGDEVLKTRPNNGPGGGRGGPGGGRGGPGGP